MAAYIVYLLCMGTAFVCCVLLFRGYWQSRARLLFWTALFFAALTVENLGLFLDNIIFPNVDLWWYRTFCGLMAVIFLLYGLISKDNK